MTWDKPERVAALVQTCFYDSATLLPALLEASGKGHTDCVRALLAADLAKPDVAAVDATEGQSALHRALTNGQEEVAKLLVDQVPSSEAARPKNRQGLDPFEAAREEDLGMVAKRMEKHLAARFAE